jgi:hypothetical protein
MSQIQNLELGLARKIIKDHGLLIAAGIANSLPDRAGLLLMEVAASQVKNDRLARDLSDLANRPRSSRVNLCDMLQTEIENYASVSSESREIREAANA